MSEMEQFEVVESLSDETKRRRNRREANDKGCLRDCYIPLRKYTPAICILEAITIVIFVLYLYMTNGSHTNPSSSEVSLGESWINLNDLNLNSSKCNQREHDLRFSVRCYSSNPQECKTYNSSYPIPNNESEAFMIVTSKSGLRFETNKVESWDGDRFDCRLKESVCFQKTQLSIDLNTEQQSIIGWGGALTDSSINSILSLTTNGTLRLLDDYFGENGLNFNMIRITIGGSDFSSRFYTNDDRPSKTNSPHLMEEDVLYKIPLLKYIQETYGADENLKIFASMWSPPVWMKSNNHFNKGYLKGSISSNISKNIEQEKYYKALADLKKNFLLAYQKNSIKFWGLTVMNEPIFAIQPFIDFNTMIFPREDYGNYIRKYLGPTIKKNPELSDIKLMAHDDNRRFLMNFTDPVLSMEGVTGYIDGVSVHGYIDEEYAQMDMIYDKYSRNNDKFFILPTELCSGHLPIMEKALIGNWNRGVHYALDIIRSLQHSAAGWVDWNMVLDTTGGPGWIGGRLDSPVIVDKKEDVYHKSPMFYTMGHFSRYIPANSKKLETTIRNDEFDYHFETVTFKHPDGNTLITVILNNNPYSIELFIRIESSSVGEGNPFRKVICSAESITTLVYKVLN